MDTTENTLELVKLEGFELKVPESQSISVAKAVVESQCTILDDKATELDNLANELECRKDELIKGWAGESVDALNSGFPELMEAFAQVSKSVRSISEWATESSAKKTEIDEKTKDLYNQIYGK